MKKSITNFLILLFILSFSLCFVSCSKKKKTNTTNGDKTKYIEFVLNDDNKSYCVAGFGTKKTSNLIIPETYNNLPVISIKEEAFRAEINLISVTIPKSITSIGKLAFWGCISLENIVVDENNLVYKAIEGNLYNKEGTTFLQYALGKSDKSFVFPDSVKTVREFSFSPCSSIVNVIVPDHVTRIENYAFHNCYNLTSVTIGSNVTELFVDAFNGCRKLVEVINKSKLNIRPKDATFSNALVVHGGESQIVNKNDYQFIKYYGDNILLGYIGTDMDIVLPESFEGKSYSFYEKTFTAKDGLRNIVIPDNLMAEIVPEMFASCRNLQSVVIGEGITVVGHHAFQGCNSLTSVTIGSSVEKIERYAFAECSNLKKISLPNSVISLGDSVFYSCDLEDVNLGESLEVIGSGAFTNCHNLTTLEIPDSVLSIGFGAFGCCDKLIKTENKIQYVDDWVIDSDLFIENAILRDGTRGIANRAFFSKQDLISVDIPKTVVAIGELAFYECKKLAVVKMLENIKIIGERAFCGCESLTSIVIPESLTMVGEQAFYRSSLSDVYYRGNKNDWNNICFDDYNSSITSAEIYYYVENQIDVPTDENNYWHYDKNENPIVW